MHARVLAEAGMERFWQWYFDVSRAALGIILVAGMAPAALADEQTIRRG